MKKYMITTCLCFCAFSLFAQDKTVESEIKNLEQNEVQAVLDKDTVTLKKLWDKDYVVNNPENKIVLAKLNSIDRPVLQNKELLSAGWLNKLLSITTLQFQWERKRLFHWKMLRNLHKLSKGDIQISG